MRRRINRTFLTATAASVSVLGLSFMAAGAAGAGTTSLPVNGPSGGAPIITNTSCTPPAAGVPSSCGMAGYQASNRLFRYGQASIVVPNHVGMAATDAALYVSLNNNSNTALDSAQVGLVPVCTAVTAGLCTTPTGVPSGWEAVATVTEPGPAGIHSSTPVLLTAADEGLGIFVSVYLSPTGNSVHSLIKTPTTTSVSGGVTTTTAGSTYNHTFIVNGPNYTDAAALADWTGVGTSAITAPAVPTVANTSAYSQFFDGRFTTWNGTKGTFNGKWIVNPVEANVLGGSTNVAGPSYLWTNDKYPGDAFGVWIYGGTAAT